MSEQITPELVAQVEAYEFVYCDVSHENLRRDTAGNPVRADNDDGHLFQLECPVAIQNKRPACPHCLIGRKPFLRLLLALDEAGVLDNQTILQKEEAEQGGKDFERLQPLDKEIRARRSFGLPNSATAEKRAEHLVAEHREIVDRMRIFRDKLVQIAHAHLAASAESQPRS